MFYHFVSVAPFLARNRVCSQRNRLVRPLSRLSLPEKFLLSVIGLTFIQGKRCGPCTRWLRNLLVRYSGIVCWFLDCQHRTSEHVRSSRACAAADFPLVFFCLKRWQRPDSLLAANPGLGGWHIRWTRSHSDIWLLAAVCRAAAQTRWREHQLIVRGALRLPVAASHCSRQSLVRRSFRACLLTATSNLCFLTWLLVSSSVTSIRSYDVKFLAHAL